MIIDKRYKQCDECNPDKDSCQEFVDCIRITLEEHIIDLCPAHAKELYQRLGEAVNPCKECITCVSYKLPTYSETCRNCTNSYSNWQPKES